MAKVEEKKASLRKDELKDVLREMLLIRRFEEKVEERFRAGELPGFLHVAIGQEACAVGVCRALEDGDVISSTHRAHGHTLAKGTHPNEIMAELYGKTEGCSHGYGASPGMVQRCFARLDEAGIPGEVRILRALSDAHPVGTQGVVWYIGGKAV